MSRKVVYVVRWVGRHGTSGGNISAIFTNKALAREYLNTKMVPSNYVVDAWLLNPVRVS